MTKIYYLQIKIFHVKIKGADPIRTIDSASGVNGNQAVSLKLLVVLAKAFRSVMDIAALDVQNYGLTISEFGILEVLYNKGQVPIQQIGAKVLISSGTMTYNLDKLERKGLVKRIPSIQDRRVIQITLTDAGRTMFDEIFPIHARSMQRAMKGLTRKQQEEAIQLLKLLGKGVHDHDSEISDH